MERFLSSKRSKTLKRKLALRLIQKSVPVHEKLLTNGHGWLDFHKTFRSSGGEFRQETVCSMILCRTFHITTKQRLGPIVSPNLKAYSQQAKARAKAKKIKEQVTNIRENFGFFFLFRLVRISHLCYGVFTLSETKNDLSSETDKMLKSSQSHWLLSAISSVSLQKLFSVSLSVKTPLSYRGMLFN